MSNIVGLKGGRTMPATIIDKIRGDVAGRLIDKILVFVLFLMKEYTAAMPFNASRLFIKGATQKCLPLGF